MISQDIIINIVSSTFVVGIATYFIQKNIDRKFNKIEEFQRTLITIRKERYDTLLKTLQEVWEKIIETEYYIRFDMVEQYKDAQQKQIPHLKFDSTYLVKAFVFIEKRSILLDKSLSQKTSELFIDYLQNTYNGLITILNKLPSGQVSLEEVNNFIPNALGTTYKLALANLRKDYEEQARKILYDEDDKIKAPN